MKILDIPQSGKRGLTVSQNGRYGQISRVLVIPANPRTVPQQGVRNTFGNTAKRWDTLQESQRLAWIAAAASQHTRRRLGQSGPMTGLQLFVKINATLADFGQEGVDVPPPLPTFQPNAPQNLVITNADGLVTLKLTCPTDPGQNTIVRATAPQPAGVAKSTDYRILGPCPLPLQGAADITALYTARFGTPSAGTKIFVQVNQFQDGYQSLPTAFSALVPRAA